MEFNNGVSVFTSDGKEVGRLKRVVVDPETHEITHIVIQKGLLFADDKVISSEMVRSSSVDRVNLKYTSKEVSELTPLTVRQQVVISGTPNREVDYNPYMNTIRDSSVITVNKRTIAANLVALKEGARVISADGNHVGNIERVFTDPETGKINQLVISQGLLLKSRRLIPFQWVQFLDDDEVRLSVNMDQLEDKVEVKN